MTILPGYLTAGHGRAFNAIADPPPHCAQGPDAAQIHLKALVNRVFVSASAIVLAAGLALLAGHTGARAQDEVTAIMDNGDLAVTGFSGTKQQGDQSFIDLDGTTLKVLDTSGRGAADARVIDAPVKFQASAGEIGQVFGVAIDNAPAPNIYATATSAFGLRIVVADENGDGIPERVTLGQPGAAFMEGQFGTAYGGGPGTVWRIDGTTGEITLFADIQYSGQANSGPGLGNIAFDPAHHQFFVSDLDTGLIHRLDLSGNDLGIYDHGVDGLGAAGFAPVEMDPNNRMDIASPAFDADDSETWGLADRQRRVWGLAVYRERLYYGVDGRIWSVGLTGSGGFAGDARVEIQSVPGDFPVSDILFTPRGRMIVAQRGGILGSADDTRFHEAGDNRVLRYARDEHGNWIQEPREYAIGFPVDHKNAAGGVGLSCDATLWSTGDRLRDNEEVAERLLNGGPLVVHGLQGNALADVRPANVLPWKTWFIAYDGQFADPQNAGHVGDVEVYRNCIGGRTESFPGWIPVPDWTPPGGWIPPVWWPRNPDLELVKIADGCRRRTLTEALTLHVPADSVGPAAILWCEYTLVITNVGAADYVGQLHVVDHPPAGSVLVPPPGGSILWNCGQAGGPGSAIVCDSVNVETLHPGESVTLNIVIKVAVPHGHKRIRNCAIVDDIHDEHGHDHGHDYEYYDEYGHDHRWHDHHGNNEDCADFELRLPDLEIKKTFRRCEYESGQWRCYFTISMGNVGAGPYHGPLHFVEHVPAGSIFGGMVDSTTPGWGCVGGPPIECTLPNATLNPGEVEHITVSIIVPLGQNRQLENCVSLGQTHANDPINPGINRACAPFSVYRPVAHVCPKGWTKVPPNGAPAGWQVVVIDGINPDGTGWSLQCMKRKPSRPKPRPRPQCPKGWTKVPANGAPPGYQVIAVDGINPDGTKWGIMCMKPKPRPRPVPHHCPKGWTKVPANGAPAGYQVIAVDGINPDGTRWGIMCMKPKPRPDRPQQPQCKRGERLLTSLAQKPKGWSVRRVVRGGRTVYCATPPKRTPGSARPQCNGGRIVMTKSIPPQYRCLCPQNKTLVRGRCVPKRVICKSGWKVVKGECRPPRPESTPPKRVCPKGWRSVRGKCIAPRPQPSRPEAQKRPQQSTPVLTRGVRLNKVDPKRTPR